MTIWMTLIAVFAVILTVIILQSTGITFAG